MNTYRFIDTDDTGYIEYDISGSAYLYLLNACFQYCSTMSFQFRNLFCSKTSSIDKLNAFRIPICDFVLENYGYDSERYEAGYYNCDVLHFKLCPQIFDFLTSITDNFFEGICTDGATLEDFAFYRADGSVFLSSVTHDGVCTLNVTDGESVCEIISKEGWRKVETPFTCRGLPDISADFQFDKPMAYPVINDCTFSHKTKEGNTLMGYHQYERCDLSKRTATGTITFTSPTSHPHCLQVGERLRIESPTQSGYATITAVLNSILQR